MKKVKHLGNVVNSSLSDTDDCILKSSLFAGSVNKLLGNFGKLDRCCIKRLYTSYCSSFYGNQLWRCNSIGFRKCCTAWNRGTRRILNLPARTHRYFLGPLTEQRPIELQLCRSIYNFVFKMTVSPNSIVRLVANTAMASTHTTIGHNIAYLRYHFGISMREGVKTGLAKFKPAITQEILSLTCVIAELLTMRDLPFNIFNRRELSLILDDICTN